MAKYNQKTLNGIYKRVVGAMSGLSDINVEINPQVTPHWDPTARAIRMPLTISYAENDEEDFIMGRGICVHEAGHVLFCPDYEPKDKDAAEWFNVFADCNNEYKVTELWPHLKEPLSNKTTTLIKRKPELLKSDNPFLQVLMRCDKLSDLKPEFPENYSPFLTEFVELVSDKFHTGHIYKATGRQLMEFTDWVDSQWSPLKNKFKEELGGSGASGKICKLQKELGDLIKARATKEEIAGKKEEIANAAKKPEWFKDEVDRRMVRVAASGESEFNDKTLDELKEMLKQPKPTGTVDSEGGWGCSDTIDASGITQMEVEIEERAPPIDKTEAYKVGKQINRALKRKVALQEDFEKNHRSGRMDIDAVRRQVGQMGQVYKENVFERTNDFSRGGQWAVEVLCDCSGSMGQYKMQKAKQALATLGYALDGLPNVHYALTGFTENSGPVDVMIKKFGEKKINIKKLDGLAAGGGNCDGFNIRSSAKRLLRFKNMKKVMIVISDGQPAYNDGIDDTKKSVKQAEHFGIGVIGVGIPGCTLKSLAEIYPHRYMFEQTDTLSKDLTNLILSKLGQKDKVKLVKRRWE